MITYVFTWVLFLSLTGLVAGSLMLGIDWIFKERIHSVFRYYIWIVVAVVMIIPIRWGNTAETVKENAARISGRDNQTYQKAANVKTVAELVNTVADTVIETNRTAKGETVAPAPEVPQKRTVKETRRFRIPLDLTPMEILAGIWLAGVLCLLVKILAQRAFVSARLYQITQKAEAEKLLILERLQNEMGIKRKIRLLTFQGGMTPFITGIYRNKIYVPQTMEPSVLALILRHELTHCRRFDILYKAVIQVVLTIHFFNPIIYLIRKRVDKYCEISCDEQAVGRLSFQERKGYTIAILNTVLQNRKHMRGTVALGENKSNLRERVELIMSDIKYSKITRTAAVALMLTAAMISTLFSGIVNASNNAEAPRIAYSCGDDAIYVTLEPADGMSTDEYSFWNAKGGYAVYRDLGTFTDLKASWIAKSKEECKALQDLFDEADGDYSAFQERQKHEDNDTQLYEVELKKLEKRYGLMENGLEGIFTVKRNYEIVADNVKGFCGNLPPYEHGYSGIFRAELVLMLDDFEGKDRILRIAMNLDGDASKRYDYEKVRYDFERSRDTKKISLGRLVEASEGGKAIDADAVNERMRIGTDRTVSAEILWNTKTKQADYCFVSRQLHEGEENGWSVLLNPYRKGLSVTDGSITGNAGKSVDINNSFIARDYEPVQISITGLDSGAGGQAQIVIRESSGNETVLKYEIVETPKVITKLAGTREVSEFMTEGEDVFVGTPAEQDDFDRDEHDRFYKRIIVDENGKVLCVIPVENQQRQMLADFTQKVQAHEDGYYYTSNGYENMIRCMYRSGTKQAGMMNKLTWWITAVITPENVFVDSQSIGENMQRSLG